MPGRTPVSLEALRGVGLFRMLDDEQLRQVHALLKEQRFRKGEIIFSQGDPGNCLFIITAGRVRIYLVSPDGREVTLRIFGPDASFGEFAVLDGAPRSGAAAAMSDVTTLILQREDFMALLKQNFTLVQHVIGMLTERLRYTTNNYEQLAFLSVPGRVAALLLQLAESSGLPDPVRLSYTQQEIADFASTTREWVNRALREFAELGLVRNERGAVVVLDRRGLPDHVR